MENKYFIYFNINEPHFKNNYFIWCNSITITIVIIAIVILLFSHLNNKCENNKCSPNGTCDNLTGNCDCKVGFTGDDCSTVIDKCLNNKCSPNGTCDNLTGNCDCKVGFTGDDCSITIDNCSNNKCSGNGTCNNSTGKCDCKVGFTGDDCSTVIDKCVNNKCSPNGTCVKLTGKCDCKVGFTGDDCSITIDNCVNNKCSPNGTCVKLTGKCDCNDGFTGDDCSKIQYKIGDSVNTNDDGLDIKGCVTKVYDDINKVDICYGKVEDNVCKTLLHNKSIDSVKKIDNIQLQCSNTNNCKNEKTACVTMNTYPVDKNFPTKDECDAHFGKSNWGSCIQHDYPYTPGVWTLGCEKDSDCPGEGRQCLDDDNGLNNLRKSCSCVKNEDCTFGDPPDNPPPSCKTSTAFGYGTLSCSDITFINSSKL